MATTSGKRLKASAARQATARSSFPPASSSAGRRPAASSTSASTAAALEAAFINPANWTWNDDTTGPAAAPVLSATAEHDLRECWLVPRSSPAAPWVLMYDGDFGAADGGRALGYATVAAEPMIAAIPTVSPLGILVLVILLTAAGVAILRT